MKVFFKTKLIMLISIFLLKKLTNAYSNVKTLIRTKFDKSNAFGRNPVDYTYEETDINDILNLQKFEIYRDIGSISVVFISIDVNINESSRKYYIDKCTLETPFFEYIYEKINTMFVTTEKLNSFNSYLFYLKRNLSWWKPRLTFKKNTIKFNLDKKSFISDYLNEYVNRCINMTVCINNDQVKYVWEKKDIILDMIYYIIFEYFKSNMNLVYKEFIQIEDSKEKKKFLIFNLFPDLKDLENEEILSDYLINKINKGFKKTIKKLTKFATILEPLNESLHSSTFLMDQCSDIEKISKALNNIASIFTELIKDKENIKANAVLNAFIDRIIKKNFKGFRKTGIIEKFDILSPKNDNIFKNFNKSIKLEEIMNFLKLDTLNIAELIFMNNYGLLE